ncbi:MAG: hypothetical protein M1820_007614 [Bogoriella megaspora]|nr:MAG: hypothetical protein M1820_007614 [Bogoriella megaspora]
MTYSWLITGASSGLGASLAIAALRAGHEVAAAAGDIGRARPANPDVENLGGIWLRVDVTSEDTQSIIQRTVEEKKINVIVNNAGFALCGVMETHTDHQIYDQFNTNVFGPFRVIRGALPSFRTRRNGTIVIISSTSGISGIAGYSMYAGTKFALEGASEALAMELAPFNIRVLIIEPGAFRTNFQNAIVGSHAAMPESYIGSPADTSIRSKIGAHGRQPGDPDKAATAIVEEVTGEGRGQDLNELLRLPLGKDAAVRANNKITAFRENVEKVKHISESAVFPEGQ